MTERCPERTSVGAFMAGEMDLTFEQLNIFVGLAKMDVARIDVAKIDVAKIKCRKYRNRRASLPHGCRTACRTALAEY